jgi:hypothetical protein
VKKIKNGGTHGLEGRMEGLQKWRLRWEIWRVCKMKARLEVLLELDFCTKPPNFGIEAHMEAPTGVALSDAEREETSRLADSQSSLANY